MTWPTRFVAVPTGQLKQDDRVEPSSKATPAQMRAYMAQVPSVYERLGAGAQPEDFQRMRASLDPESRAIGDAYHHLFAPSGTDHRLEAEIVEGKGLVVTRGRHRIEAARDIGVPFVPVHVRAVDESSLDAATRRFEADLEPTSPAVVTAQREMNDAHHGARADIERSATQVSSAQSADRAAKAVQASGQESRTSFTSPTRSRDRR